MRCVQQPDSSQPGPSGAGRARPAAARRDPAGSQPRRLQGSSPSRAGGRGGRPARAAGDRGRGEPGLSVRVRLPADGKRIASQRFEWVADGVTAELDNRSCRTCASTRSGSARLAQVGRAKRAVRGQGARFSATTRRLRAQDSSRSRRPDLRRRRLVGLPRLRRLRRRSGSEPGRARRAANGSRACPPQRSAASAPRRCCGSTSRSSAPSSTRHSTRSSSPTTSGVTSTSIPPAAR